LEGEFPRTKSIWVIKLNKIRLPIKRESEIIR